MSNNQEKKNSKTSEQIKKSQETINEMIDETTKTINQNTDQVKKAIPRFTDTFNAYYQDILKLSNDITVNYIESQKHLVNAYQSAFTQFVDNVYSTNWNTSWTKKNNNNEFMNVYSNIVNDFVTNSINTSKFINNMMINNMELLTRSIEKTKEHTDELSKICVDFSKLNQQQH